MPHLVHFMPSLGKNARAIIPEKAGTRENIIITTILCQLGVNKRRRKPTSKVGLLESNIADY